jgi:hypothetical protein
VSAMEFHPLADLFPMLDAGHADELAADIRANGLRQVIATFEGKILDGRNRYLACIAAGVEPMFEEYTGDDPLGYAVSLNLTRRHLNDGQRAMIAARISTLRHGQRSDRVQGVPIGPSSKMLNVSTRSVKRAREVLAKGTPELVDKVQRGEVSVSAAALSLHPSKEDQAKRTSETAKSYYLGRQEAKLGPLNAGQMATGSETHLIPKKLRTDLTVIRTVQRATLRRLRSHAGVVAIKGSIKRTVALINDALGNHQA